MDDFLFAIILVMKVFVSYKYANESIERLEEILLNARNALGEMKIKSHCSYFAVPNGIDPNDGPNMMKSSFSELKKSDLLLAIQDSESRSEGMLMEVGYAIACNKPLIIFTKNDVKNTYLPGIADLSIYYSDVIDLHKKIKQIDFSALVNNKKYL